MSRHVPPRKTVLVFGSQTLSFDEQSFQKLRSSIAEAPELDWVPAAISKLPNDFNSVVAGIPIIHAGPGLDHLLALRKWIETGALPGGTTWQRLPNIVLTPLCVVSQLDGYIRYLKLVREDHGQTPNNADQDVHPLVETEAVGFCTGLLAALAVSLSTTQEQLQRHGATALRLAMMIGALVDAQDAVNGDSASISTRWKNSDDLDTLRDILDNHHDVGNQLPPPPSELDLLG